MRVQEGHSCRWASEHVQGRRKYATLAVQIYGYYHQNHYYVYYACYDIVRNICFFIVRNVCYYITVNPVAYT